MKKSTTRDLSKVSSTTGNIYGIYDMSGGSFEHVMANMQDSSNAFYPKNADTWSATNKPLDKYYDKYSYGTTLSETRRGKLGDATIEMKPIAPVGGWYEDYAGFPYGDEPLFTRGEMYWRGNLAGLFSFAMGRGGAREDYYSSTGCSRTVLSISSQ